MPGRGKSRSSARTGSRAPGTAYDAAVRYLGPRPRSVAEVRRHLLKKRLPEAEARAAIARLLDQGYLDDVAFARYWLEQRDRFRPKGDLALRAELRQRGVDAGVIDEALGGREGSDEAERAWAALEPRLGRWRTLDIDARKAKAQSFLRQRGFSFDAIDEVLARL